MSDPQALLERCSREALERIVLSSPKKLREELFRRAGLKGKGGAFSLRAAAKEGRAAKLYDRLHEGLQLSSELCEEVIRQYLYGRRDLLAAALDHFEIPHEDGLTNSDVEFMQTLKPAQVTKLRQVLASYDPEDVALYLGFMGVPDAE
jgi:hypothetical protein